MEKQNILGLDLGTNSIGWAIVSRACSDEQELLGIVDAGSRIIPMDAAMQSDFAKGNTISQTANRTMARSARRLQERFCLRRERLHRILAILGFLPQHYLNSLTRYGKFKSNTECKLAWNKTTDGKWEFLFMDSYHEMLELFWHEHPTLLQQGMKVPYDWTLYYLRHKALYTQLTPQELAWVLLNFNQKRGYNQARGDESDDDNKKERKEFLELTVVNIEKCDDLNSKKQRYYNIHFNNGMVWNQSFKERPNWEGQTMEMVVTTKLDDKGNEKTDKEGKVMRTFRAPKENDWTLIKLKTEQDIIQSNTTTGSYIFNAILSNPKQKINGKLVRTIDRKFYKEELRRIIDTQKRFIPQLTDVSLYEQCVSELYQHNEAYANSIATKHDFKYLFVDDIIFYQRPLKSKKSLIDNCPYEWHEYTDRTTGEIKKQYLKCVPKSHPLYQEYRLWQLIGNIRIYKNRDDDGNLIKEQDVTAQFLPDVPSCVALFEHLNNIKEIDQKGILKYFKIKQIKGQDCAYHWNYGEDKKLPANTTRSEILHHLKKASLSHEFLTPEAEQKLWHILYSVSDRNELYHALMTFARGTKPQDVDTRSYLSDFITPFADAMVKFPPFKSEYGAYSLKALKKLLPLMRMGKFWKAEDIDTNTRQRIEMIINGETDDTISPRVREKAISLTEVSHFSGLPTWMACYVVYDRHSEAQNADRWTTPDHIDAYLKAFKQHSLHNPVVEQVVTETLRTVRDIWRKHGHIDEIHLEMGRELKNPADKRKKMTENMLRSEQTNLRIKALLMEFMNPEFEIADVRPYSPSQQELLRIYEEGALQSADEIDEDINIIIKKFAETDTHKRPTHSEIVRYKLWLEQRYVSPYTGQPIPLARLFTRDYEIEHVIPQSRYFDDSMSNKVICEATVNSLKDNRLGYEFIKECHGDTITLGDGRTVRILETDSYRKHIEQTYKRNPAKMKKLLMDEIPSDFIERQLNDSRYISKFIKSLLSNIVREENEHEATAKKLIVCTGAVTDRLKKDWGCNEVWNSIILPRFERMEAMSIADGHPANRFIAISDKGHRIPAIPLELSRGFNKKRIDHRHHAMDAIVIACATRNHVNLLSNEAASPKSNTNRQQLSHKLRRYEKEMVSRRCGTPQLQSVAKEFFMPWATFPADMKKTLANIIVSFKQNLRVITRTSNRSLRYVDGKKKLVLQEGGDNWAIRKALHEDTIHGEIFLNGERFLAHRTPLNSEFNRNKIEKEIADTAIQKILLHHLENNNNDSKEAFSPEGIIAMNQNIIELNDGKSHQPIYNVRIYKKSNNAPVGSNGAKAKKFAKTATGTNLFFVVNEIEKAKKGLTTKKRNFRTIPLREVIAKQKQGLPLAEDALFILSPNDLVYLPTPEEIESGINPHAIDKSRIYKCVSFDSGACNFVQANVATTIQDKKEFSLHNKMQTAITGEMIKDLCVPLKIDRIGNIIKIGV